MRFFDIGQEANGFIAVGQIATGVFAFGQVATGVVAVGQGARGVIAVGQGAIGVVAVGMGAVGLIHSVAMLGIGGRGLGGVLPLTPSLGVPYQLPRLGVSERGGWARATLRRDEDGRARLQASGLREVRLQARLRAAADAQLATGEPEVFARLVPDGESMTAVELLQVPRSRLGSPRWWVIWALQSLGMVAVAALIWVVCLLPLLPIVGIRLNVPPGMFP